MDTMCNDIQEVRDGVVQLKNGVEALDLISAMLWLTMQYQNATVGDLLELVGLSAESVYTDSRIGWHTKNLRNIVVEPGQDGWVVKFPQPELLV